MARAGIFEVSELATFRKLNSRLQGHPATHEHLEGVRIALVHWAKDYQLQLVLLFQKK